MQPVPAELQPPFDVHVPLFSFGAHVSAPHDPFPHVTSQAQAPPQLTSPHALGPEQVTSQLPVHVTPPHAVLPRQLSTQVLAVQLTLPQPMPAQLTTHAPLPQLTAPQAPPVGQLIVHEYPVGQVTLPPLPSITHVRSAGHDEHSLGHAAPPSEPASVPEPDPKTQ